MLDLPAPVLRHFCTLEVEAAAPRNVGMGRLGQRRIVPIAGGRVSGPTISGRIVPGGADWLTTGPDGTAHMDARYAFETDDGALIEIIDQGYRHGPEAVIHSLLAGEPVAPDAYYMRSTTRLECGHPDYVWVNRTIFVSRGAKTPSGVQIDIYAVE